MWKCTCHDCPNDTAMLKGAVRHLDYYRHFMSDLVHKDVRSFAVLETPTHAITVTFTEMMSRGKKDNSTKNFQTDKLNSSC